MRLDVLNQWLGVKTPAQAFKACLRCKGKDLFDFEGEIFCQNQKCGWDSVELHAEALAFAQLYRQQLRGAGAPELRKVTRQVPIPENSVQVIRVLLGESFTAPAEQTEGDGYDVA